MVKARHYVILLTTSQIANNLEYRLATRYVTITQYITVHCGYTA